MICNIDFYVKILKTTRNISIYFQFEQEFIKKKT